VVLGVFALAVASVDGDVDLWGRMAIARDAEQSGALLFPRDVYSYTAPGAPWFDHEWGFNHLAYGTFRALGFGGIRLLRLVLFALAAALSLRGLFRESRSPALAAIASAIWGAGALVGFYGPRAASVGYVFFAWMAMCLSRAEDDARWLLFAVLPVPLWVNVHGGFFAGVAVAGLWGLVRLLQLWRRRRLREARWIGLAGAYCALCACLTPLGPSLAVAAVRQAFYARPFIPEWDPIAPLSREMAAAALLVAASLPALLRRRRRLAEIAVLAAVAFASFRHARHLPFFAISAAALSMPIGARWLEEKLAAIPVARRLKVAARAAALAALAIAFCGIGLELGRKVGRPEPGEPLFPRAAAGYLRQRHAGDGGIVEFNWSMYSLFEDPGVKQAFDGRYTDVYPFAAYRAYFEWHFGLDGWERGLVADPRTRFALVASGSERDRRMRGLPGWHVAHQDGVATVFEPSGMTAGR